MQNLKFQIFGSPSSKDYDVLVFVDKLGTIQENHDLIDTLNDSVYQELIKNGLPSKKMNCNLGVLENGKLKEVFKGYAFEVNNSLYYTYGLHTQLHPNHIIEPYKWSEEIADYKLKRCFRFILSFYSRVPEWRTSIKEALKGGFDKRLECVKKIDFIKHREFPGKKDLPEDIYKTFAFQIGQTHALLTSIELYTKESVIREYTSLENLILRKEITDQDLEALNLMLHYLIMTAEIRLEKMENLLEEL